MNCSGLPGKKRDEKALQTKERSGIVIQSNDYKRW